nr:Chain C, PROTEIN (VSV8) [synthetic construct]1BQH_F Chain F, PROTEIN (VSV8) [synthetic construct]1FZJ_P Chain P, NUCLEOCAPSID PROTEIN [synthetic construct]1FZM_P Chain P, PROTEIN (NUCLEOCAPSID PROTEIN) [synthetic construct]1KPU_P Chain P, nucleocapsid [synthetic construct]1NAM_P Chain P, Nucleocapsid [synthetic construct]2MHA_E Chain E, VIRAL OCTAPEPTIDE ARG-GLY-TYR-VAL-TYR-GLN-GLY-LEU [Vesicular stomatitis virus]2MHA_F Chain F, VIRAL OCTAPEPTIDE ARG-GLY-TYR-VAL-TYR-GLN-GLY-LEU [Vesicular
RGYVYQGL